VNASNYDSDDCKRDVCTPDSDDPAGQTWISLDMTFDDNSFLAGQTPSCGGIDSGDSIFTAPPSCSYDSGTQKYTLDFSGGSIAPGESFLIVEETDVNQFNRDGKSEFGTGTAVVGTVPEPNSALLLATGGGMFGLALFADRRRLLGQSPRS
jgi:hypothetical protein